MTLEPLGLPPSYEPTSAYKSAPENTNQPLHHLQSRLDAALYLVCKLDQDLHKGNPSNVTIADIYSAVQDSRRMVAKVKRRAKYKPKPAKKTPPPQRTIGHIIRRAMPYCGTISCPKSGPWTVHIKGREYRILAVFESGQSSQRGWRRRPSAKQIELWSSGSEPKKSDNEWQIWFYDSSTIPTVRSEQYLHQLASFGMWLEKSHFVAKA